MLRLRRKHTLQKFSSVYGFVHNQFNHKGRLANCDIYKA